MLFVELFVVPMVTPPEHVVPAYLENMWRYWIIVGGRVVGDIVANVAICVYSKSTPMAYRLSIVPREAKYTIGHW